MMSNDCNAAMQCVARRRFCRVTLLSKHWQQQLQAWREMPQDLPRQALEIRQQTIIHAVLARAPLALVHTSLLKLSVADPDAYTITDATTRSSALPCSKAALTCRQKEHAGDLRRATP